MFGFIPSAKNSLIAWMTGKRAFGFTLCSFDDYAWRISSRSAARRFGYVKQRPSDQWLSAQSPEHPFELSFCGEDVPLVAVPELFEFVESMPRAKHESDVFQWSVFSHDENYPHYAWTEGSPEIGDALYICKEIGFFTRRPAGKITRGIWRDIIRETATAWVKVAANRNTGQN